MVCKQTLFTSCVERGGSMCRHCLLYRIHTRHMTAVSEVTVTDLLRRRPRLEIEATT